MFSGWQFPASEFAKIQSLTLAILAYSPENKIDIFFASRTHQQCITRHSRVAGGLCWVKTINNQH